MPMFLLVRDETDRCAVLTLPCLDEELDRALSPLDKKTLSLRFIEIDYNDETLSENLQEDLMGHDTNMQELRELNLLSYLLERLSDTERWQFSVYDSGNCDGIAEYINMAYFEMQDEVEDSDDFDGPYQPERLDELIKAERDMTGSQGVTSVVNGHNYRFTACGPFLHPDTVTSALEALGLKVTGSAVSYSLERRLADLPEEIPSLAVACKSALNYLEDMDEWDSYSYIPEVKAACVSDDVSLLTGAILKCILKHEDHFRAAELTGDLLMGGMRILEETARAMEKR